MFAANSRDARSEPIRSEAKRIVDGTPHFAVLLEGVCRKCQRGCFYVHPAGIVSLGSSERMNILSVRHFISDAAA